LVIARRLSESLIAPAAGNRRDRTRKSARSALRSHSALRVQAERLVAAYVAPESNREAIINKLIVRFDGPAQREARMLTAEAKGEAWQERLPLRSQATFLPGSIPTIDASARNKGQKRSVGGHEVGRSRAGILIETGVATLQA
jgi:hypothetical protein